MKKAIVLLKIILAIVAICTISLGAYLFSNAGTEKAAPLTSWALVMNSLIVVLLLGIYAMEKRVN
ncbi:hypothetical protein KTG14_13825 [Planococcus sp. CP5-4_YE]|uniref:hypothetical protein n=1 Tax=unclassified Planococcus (in: firmicutes) TaxID=2662419 RepID=UPI001C2B9AD8|nr:MULTISPECIES: hypothetical protein [unclassified Planococcus (in: firmicutes)]MBU9674478.1 hypothetical protein [Planococcus sp. CP5-4_YE]MBV0910109.1 hypothetical protein [Planococcus sp. CP5-4_UN]